MPPRFEKLGESADLGGQEGDLHFAAPGVRAGARRFGDGVGVGSGRGRFGRQGGVGTVAPQGGDDALGVDAKSVLRIGEGQGGDASQRFFCSVFLLLPGGGAGFGSGVGCGCVGKGQAFTRRGGDGGSGEVGATVEAVVEFVFAQEEIEAFVF